MTDMCESEEGIWKRQKRRTSHEKRRRKKMPLTHLADFLFKAGRKQAILASCAAKHFSLWHR